jgi:hypothetical protein
MVVTLKCKCQSTRQQHNIKTESIKTTRKQIKDTVQKKYYDCYGGIYENNFQDMMLHSVDGSYYVS